MDEPLTKFFLNFGKMNTSHGADLRSLVGVARYDGNLRLQKLLHKLKCLWWIDDEFFVLSNYASKWNAAAIATCQQVWQYHKFFICHYFQLLPLPLLLQSDVSQIFMHLWLTLCQEFLSSHTNYFLRYLIRPMEFLHSVKICITEWPSFEQTFI